MKSSIEAVMRWTDVQSEAHSGTKTSGKAGTQPSVETRSTMQIFFSCYNQNCVNSQSNSPRQRLEQQNVSRGNQLSGENAQKCENCFFMGTFINYYGANHFHVNAYHLVSLFFLNM